MEGIIAAIISGMFGVLTWWLTVRHERRKQNSGVVIDPATQHTRFRLTKKMAIIALAVIVPASLIYFFGHWSGRKSPSGAEKIAIAVLPFSDMSAEKNQEYFSDGLAEEVLNVLARNPNLQVTSRTSAFSFKGKGVDLKTISEKLKVTHVLEGSVRKAGNQLRISAQLIEVATDSHLWSQTYDRKMENIFAVQDDIAKSVAGALKVTLEGGASPKTEETNPEAYNAYLQGRYFYEHRNRESYAKAVGYYQQAVHIDPNYARAWAGLAGVHSRQASDGYLPVDEGYTKARSEAEKALKLNPNLAEAHSEIGWIKMTYDWDWIGANAAYQRAMELEPANANVVTGAGALAGTLGQFDEAIRLVRRASKLDPLRIAPYNNLGLYAYFAGRFSEAEAAYKKVAELNPQFPGARYGLGRILLEQSKPEEALAQMLKEPDPVWRDIGSALAYHAAGKKKEADTALAQCIEKYRASSAYQIAEIHAFRGEADEAFDWLERAYQQRDGGLADMKGDPLLRNIERDPRYRAFLQKMKLPLD